MISLTNRFGYSELYELNQETLNYFSKFNMSPYGRFVQFNNEEPFDSIKLCTEPSEYIGVTSANPSFISNEQNEWPGKYYINITGETIYESSGELVKGRLINIDEGNGDVFEIISTYNEGYPKPIINESYDENRPYVNRLNRAPWITVTLLGKCIVLDNGECVPGQYCTINRDDNPDNLGIAVPVTNSEYDENVKFKVLQRLSEKSIVIFLK